MSTSSSTPSSSRWRFTKQVFVEIPPSPLHTNRHSPMHAMSSRLSLSSVNHKANTPLRSSITMPSDLQSNKRKSEPSPVQPPPKKPKVDTSPMAPEASADTSNLINCHHCKAKRPPEAIVACTFRISRNPASKPTRSCGTRYCRNCLQNRYMEDFDRITTSTQGQKENGHADAAYVFKCPKCRGQCSCWKCKKRAAANSNTTNATTTVSTNVVQMQHSTSIIPVGSLGARMTSVPMERSAKPLVLPNVTWSTVATPLSLQATEDRILIREFVLRFSGLPGMSLSKVHLEELEHIGGTNGAINDEGDGDNDTEELVYTSWVSEACVKSLVLSLIGVLAAEEDSSATLVMKNAMKDIRKSGVNLTKIWAVLSTLRSALGRPEKPEEPEEKDSDAESSEDRIILEYPDPSPPPIIANTRSTRSSSTEFPVLCTAQMIPVLLGLIETVLESHAIRVELDNGTKEGREKFRESRECIRLANEQFDQLKKSLEEAQEPDQNKIKSERQVLKSKVQAIDNAAKVIAPAFLPRFSPLGTDLDGRIYWALTPGIHDREYALEYISSRLPNAPKSKKPRNRKHRQQKDEVDRKAFKEWTWFLAVWGKKPDGEKTAEGSNEPQWWGFWDPAEIRKLADWISVKHTLKTADNPSAVPHSVSDALKNLVKGVTEYATVLEWRAGGEDD